jgi:hypothetical protein
MRMAPELCDQYHENQCRLHNSRDSRVWAASLVALSCWPRNKKGLPDRNQCQYKALIHDQISLLGAYYNSINPLNWEI